MSSVGFSWFRPFLESGCSPVRLCLCLSAVSSCGLLFPAFDVAFRQPCLESGSSPLCLCFRLSAVSPCGLLFPAFDAVFRRPCLESGSTLLCLCFCLSAVSPCGILFPAVGLPSLRLSGDVALQGLPWILSPSIFRRSSEAGISSCGVLRRLVLLLSAIFGGVGDLRRLLTLFSAIFGGGLPLRSSYPRACLLFSLAAERSGSPKFATGTVTFGFRCSSSAAF